MVRIEGNFKPTKNYHCTNTPSQKKSQGASFDNKLPVPELG